MALVKWQLVSLVFSFQIWLLNLNDPSNKVKVTGTALTLQDHVLHFKEEKHFHSKNHSVRWNELLLLTVFIEPAAQHCMCFHTMLQSTSRFWRTRLHLRHKINFQIARLWDDQFSVTSSVPQHCYIGFVVSELINTLLYWICCLRADKYKRACWLRVLWIWVCPSFLSFFFYKIKALQPLPRFIDMSGPLLLFSYCSILSGKASQAVLDLLKLKIYKSRHWERIPPPRLRLYLTKTKQCFPLSRLSMSATVSQWTKHFCYTSNLLSRPHASSLCYITHITLHISHCTLHIAHCILHIHIHIALLCCILHFTLYSLPLMYSYFSLFFLLCIVLIVFLCFMFFVCTYIPRQIPGRCKPTWQ